VTLQEEFVRSLVADGEGLVLATAEKRHYGGQAKHSANPYHQRNGHSGSGPIAHKTSNVFCLREFGPKAEA
jgi:hypothetical protein